MILFIENKYAHYHLSGRSKDCKINASNNYMLDVAIQFSKEKGCDFFHFGGGSSSLENDTLLKFKSNFSKTKLDFYIGYKTHNKQIYNIICKDWENKNPCLKSKMKNFFLKYRILNNYQ
jgi:lipid II:glycine glycyltransferase (peptidoglycan interpeptide bridge formation enzyme)